MLLRFTVHLYAAVLGALTALAVGYLIFHQRTGQLAALVLGLALGGMAVWALRHWRVPALTARQAGRWLLALVLLATVVRAAWLAAVPTVPVSDFRYYHECAVGLAWRGVFGVPVTKGASAAESPLRPTAVCLPGYPLLLAAGYRLFGVTILWGYALNLLLAAGMQVAVFYSVRELGGRLWGLLAAAGVGLHPSLVVSTSLLGTDLAGAALLAIAAALLLAGCRRHEAGGLALAAGGGLSLGTAIHCRPFLIALVPIYLLAA